MGVYLSHCALVFYSVLLFFYRQVDFLWVLRVFVADSLFKVTVKPVKTVSWTVNQSVSQTFSCRSNYQSSSNQTVLPSCWSSGETISQSIDRSINQSLIPSCWSNDCFNQSTNPLINQSFNQSFSSSCWSEWLGQCPSLGLPGQGQQL